MTEYSEDSLPRYMTIPETAKYLQMSMCFLYNNWRRYGGRKLGGSIRIDRLELDRIIREGGENGHVQGKTVPIPRRNEEGKAVVRGLPGSRKEVSEMVQDQDGGPDLGADDSAGKWKFEDYDPDRHEL